MVTKLETRCEVFAVSLSSSITPLLEGVWVTGRELMISDANDAEVAMAGLALGMFGWHDTAVYDGRTGSRTVPVEGGMKRQVEGGTCKLYPRTDPVAIGLILSPDGTKCLLGRNRNYPEGMYTCLSGFVDLCESVEEAFAREAMEEAGVTLANVSLVASQPWPIGRAGSCELMVACHAISTSERFQVNPAEIEDARWFTRAEAKQMLERSVRQPYAAEVGALYVPPRFAIAHHLIKGFVASKPVASNSLSGSWGGFLFVAILGFAAGLVFARLRPPGGRRF